VDQFDMQRPLGDGLDQLRRKDPVGAEQSFSVAAAAAATPSASQTAPQKPNIRTVKAGMEPPLLRRKYANQLCPKRMTLR
jgi:hypothetical protein